MNIRNKFEKNELTLWIYLKVRSIIFLTFIYPIILLKELSRKCIFKNSYGDLKKFKNKHARERCFIVGTGPSLEKSDLIKLKDEFTIGVNGLCLLFEELDWKTNYFMISDGKAYEKLKGDLPKDDTKNIFISCFDKEYIDEKYTYVPRNVKNNFLMTNKYKRFRCNVRIGCFDAHTVVFNAMQVAAYMGFKEIYLLGVDCNYDDNPNKRYFINHGIVNPYYKSAGINMIEDFKVAKKYTEKLGIKVYNASSGGMLEVFKRVDLDSVLNNKKNT